MKRPAVATLVLALAGGLLWWALRDVGPTPPPLASPLAGKKQPQPFTGLPSSLGLGSHAEEEMEAPDGAISNEAVLVFQDADAYEKFLQNLPKGSRLLGSNPKLRAVRLALTKKARAALGKDLPNAEMGGNFPVFAPTPPNGSDPVASGQAFNRAVLADIGITGSRAGYGKGVTVAILDTAVGEHPMLKALSGALDLVKADDSSTDFSGHGTAVASLIAGQGRTLAGPAPEASLLSVRVLDESGQGDTFTVAQGIVAAVDAGAKVLNLSLAGSGDSPALKAAVSYALDHGAVIVAAAGNDASDSLSYPAAYKGVISVGATDATTAHAPFSNTGEGLSLSAPGVGIPAAYGDNEAIAFTGTSAATPLVSGAIAAILSLNPTITPAEAAQLLSTYANDNGAAGADPNYGAGIIDVERVLRRNEPTLADAAISSVLLSTAPNGQDEIYTVNVQNRGNLTLGNVAIQVQTPTGPIAFRLPSLAAGQTASQALPAQAPASPGQTAINAVVTIAGATDSRPANDSRIVTAPQPAATTETKAP